MKKLSCKTFVLNDYSFQPFRDIWFSPAKTFQALASRGKGQKLYVWPVIIVGLTWGLELAPSLSLSLEEGSFSTVIAIALPIAIVAAFIVLCLLFPVLVLLTGKLWRGKASMRQLANVFSIASIPYGLLLIYLVLLIATGNFSGADNVSGIFTYILTLWTFVLLVIGVSKVQGFSYAIATLNLIVAYLPILLLGLLFR